MINYKYRESREGVRERERDRQNMSWSYVMCCTVADSQASYSILITMALLESGVWNCITVYMCVQLHMQTGKQAGRQIDREIDRQTGAEIRDCGLSGANVLEICICGEGRRPTSSMAHAAKVLLLLF